MELRRLVNGAGAAGRRSLDLLQRIVCAARLSFEICTLLDGEALMDNVAFHMGLRLERNAQAPDRAPHPSAHDDVFGDDAAHTLRCFAEQERTAMNVPLYLTVDLDLTLGG